MTDCKFFFSYARNDESEYLDDFLDLLRKSVMTKAAVKQPELVAFRDTDDIDLGEKWTPDLEHALQTSSVFICVYSPSYFASDYCGRELSIFQSRISEYTKTHQINAPLILPILWEAPDIYKIPDCLSEIQFSHHEIHEDYVRKGLLTFSKLSKYRDPYLEFVELFAKKIVTISQNYKLPEAPIKSIDDVKSAFTKKSLDIPLPINTKPLRNFTPKDTILLYIIGTSEEVKQVKNDVESYSSKSEYWKPFFPDEDEIGIISSQIVTKKKLHPIHFNFSEEASEIIREAEESNCVTVVVIDPWSTKLKAYSKNMLKFDKQRYINCSVIIVWNELDNETITNHDDLQSSLEKSLYHYMLENSTAVKNNIKTLTKFKSSIYTAIDEAQAKLLKRAKHFRTLDGEGGKIPLLSGQEMNNG